MSSKDIIQPLNWHLTTAELQQIRDKASDSKADAAIEDAKGWVRSMLNPEPANGSSRI